MTTELSAHIIKALEGSSGQKPVYVDALRKIADKICDDPNVLYTLLDKLYAERRVNRCAGMREGKPYLAYWLTGAIQQPEPFRIVQAPRVHPVRRDAPQPEVQPKTAEPSPTQTQEQPMGKRPEASAGLSQLIADLVNQHAAGITLDDLHRKVTETMPKITVKQVFDITYYLHAQHKIVRDGKGKAAKLLPGTGQPEATPRPRKPRSASAPSIPAPAARKTGFAPPQDGQALQAIFRLDGTLTISKGDAVLELDAGESARLARFAAQINPPAECIALA